MKKTVFSLLAMITGVSMVTAQSLDDGKKELYYEKYTSAEQTLQKVVNKNPKDGESIYWLGQVYLENFLGEPNGPAKAQKLYQGATAVGANDPWLLVGLGEIDYINGNNSAAEQKFEQAMTLSDKAFRGRHKDEAQAALFTAIGRASAYGDRAIGDPAYAIPVLQKAMNLDKAAPEAALYLGMNYLKLGGDQGGNAFVAFNTATTRDPKFAAGFYHAGLIFHSQDNFEVMDEWYQKGITADPAYGPIYLDYFDYYKAKDVNKAKEYLDKYVANSDNGCTVQYFQADYLFQAGKYQESLAKAKEMEAGTCSTFPHLPLLMAADYHRLGDVNQAVTYAKKFFSTVSASNIQPYDYAFAGYIYKDDSTLADTAVTYLMKAYDLDTVKANKEIYSDSIAYALDIAKKPIEKYNWLRKLYDAKDTSMLSNLDIFNTGQAALDAGKLDSTYYPVADSMFTFYTKKYPTQRYGFQYLVMSKLAALDSAAALPAIDQYAAFTKTDTNTADTAFNRQFLVQSYYSVLPYFLNTKGDYVTSLQILDNLVALDSTDATAKQYDDQIRDYLNKKNGAASTDSTGAKQDSTKAKAKK